ncbi:MAG: hypothetical protein RRY95_00850 [Oscillospiraceae bacterium]
MTFYFENMELEEVGILLHGRVNDVLVCCDLRSPAAAQYTLLTIRDSDCKKKLLSVLEKTRGERPDWFCFARNEVLIYGFPYRPERKFSAFARGQLATPAIGEAICFNLIMACVSSPLPFPLLYLVLAGDGVNLTRDNDIFFTPVLDLALLDENISEKDCTRYCARMLITLLEESSKKRLKSGELLRRKCDSNSYSAFSELYRDIRLTAIPAEKTGFWARFRGFWRRNRDRLFHLFLALCVPLVILALVMLVSQLIFGDIPLLRLFRHCFEMIGTESMG